MPSFDIDIDLHSTGHMMKNVLIRMKRQTIAKGSLAVRKEMILMIARTFSMTLCQREIADPCLDMNKTVQDDVFCLLFWESLQHLLMRMPKKCVSLYVTVFTHVSLSGLGGTCLGRSGGRFMASHRAAAHKSLQAIGSVPVAVVNVVAPDSRSAPWYTDMYHM